MGVFSINDVLSTYAAYRITKTFVDLSNVLSFLGGFLEAS
jgi:hypothetical protein